MSKRRTGANGASCSELCTYTHKLAAGRAANARNAQAEKPMANDPRANREAVQLHPQPRGCARRSRWQPLQRGAIETAPCAPLRRPLQERHKQRCPMPTRQHIKIKNNNLCVHVKGHETYHVENIENDSTSRTSGNNIMEQSCIHNI